ncbi:MAG: PIG-L family deacetylase [Candidatus Omnitrophica bacterium]|nr:PIG-L family deacetylase [Candidatus Omnitrophota bacterium]
MQVRFKRYLFLFVGFLVIFIILSSRVSAETKEIPLLEPFTKEDRVLVLAPHPDDEDIGCGGVIQRALKSGSQVKVVYLTCGDNNIFSIIFYNKFLFPLKLLFLKKKDFIDLGHQRVHEAIEAMKVLGLNEKDLIFLGYPDHGTDQMFVYNWKHEKPYRSSFSGHANVPYEESIGYKKEYTADNVIEDVKRVVSNYKPTKIFVSSSSDVNGDHWAYYLYLMASLADLNKQVPAPKIYPYLVHAPGWPLPRHYHPELEIEPSYKFFGDALALVNWRQLRLTKEEIEKKHQAMLAYDSQVRVSAFYLMAFVRQNELFGDFPSIVLKRQYPIDKPEHDVVFTSDTQWFGYAVVNDYLWIRFKKPKELKHRLNVTFSIFGYRYDVPFAKMPNTLVRIKYNKFSVYNATEDSKVCVAGASLDFNPESVIFKIPLSVLGNPEGFLFGFETSEHYLPVGSTSFRVISIE